MSDEKPFYEPADGETDDKPCFELYIKASSIDGETKGSCPICQQWFMVAYTLAENKNVSFRVYTVQANMPPKSFKDRVSSHNKYPVVIGLNGKNGAGADITDIVADDFDEVESFFESVNFDCPKLKRIEMANGVALKIFEDLYKHFNGFLQNQHDFEGRTLLSDLRNINSFLEEQGHTFLTGSTMSYSDCVLLPRLQHIRVAAKAYKNFEIPQDLKELWRYMENGYHTNAFLATLPSDQDIVLHYEKKAATKLEGSFKPTLQKRTFSTEVPIVDGLNGE